MKAKVINIMSHGTAYDLYWDGPGPRVKWELPGGSFAGIWDTEWLDLIGNEVLKVTRDFEFEVWQPDSRADRVYRHRFANGLCHVLFPCVQLKIRQGMKVRQYLFSKQMNSALEAELKAERVIIRTDPVTGLGRHALKVAGRAPTIVQFWGKVSDPLAELVRPGLNIPGKLYDLMDFSALKKTMKNADIITCSDKRSMMNLERHFGNKCISLSVGIDFGFWKPRPDRERIRRALGLDTGKKVLFSSSRLNSLKQVDKVIGVLNTMCDEFDFVFVVSGHGEREYENHLVRLGERLLKAGKLVFTGYLSDEKLADYYGASDLFITSSLSEAGPTATVKALAMEIPVFTTDTGQMAEVMAAHHAGVIVPRHDYGVWEKELREIMSGKEVRVLDREIVKKIHHWPYVARQYIEIYNMLYGKYYGNNHRKEGVHEGC